jgi:FMN reductase
MARILGVSGSLREGSNTLLLVNKALEFARKAGADTRLLDLREYPLPLYEAHAGYDNHTLVNQITELVNDCDALVLGSPEYHGCMSGAMKNFMDFLYREFAGKVVGLVSATGGSQGNGCFDNMRAAVHACHGWVLPYVTAANGRDFNEQRELINPRTMDRLRRMARDLTFYGPLLNGQFKADLEQSPDAIPGFAQWLA